MLQYMNGYTENTSKITESEKNFHPYKSNKHGQTDKTQKTNQFVSPVTLFSFKCTSCVL